jgi:hypothetical protein
MAWYDVRPLVVGLKSTRIAAQPSLSFSKKRLGFLGTQEARTWQAQE